MGRRAPGGPRGLDRIRIPAAPALPKAREPGIGDPGSSLGEAAAPVVPVPLMPPVADGRRG